MGKIRTYLLAAALFGLFVLAIFIYHTNNKKQKVKEDLVELSNIKYGLFNVDEWKKILTDILTKKIEEFDLGKKNRKDAKVKISGFLTQVISDLEVRYYEENRGSLGGFFKNTVASGTGIFRKIKNDIPIFTDQILGFLNDPKNKKAVRAYLVDKLNNYADSTFAKMDYTLHDYIIKKYEQQDRHSAITYLNTELELLNRDSNVQRIYIALFAILTAVIVLVSKVLAKSEFLLLTAICFLFLVLGLSLPMIEIDARVSEIKLSLLGEKVVFVDQVLYYRSKSILEVVNLMMRQGSFDLLLVGSLVLIFSVLFPMAKLISSVYLVSSGLPAGKFLHFLVHKTAKWSMADVMVVAIFMSYVGFSGILTEQLNQIEGLSEKLEVLTTNKSSLQIGFFAFTGFALLSLLATGKLKTKLREVVS